jgi:hypothetical protein
MTVDGPNAVQLLRRYKMCLVLVEPCAATVAAGSIQIRLAWRRAIYFRPAAMGAALGIFRTKIGGL